MSRTVGNTRTHKGRAVTYRSATDLPPISPRSDVDAGGCGSGAEHTTEGAPRARRSTGEATTELADESHLIDRLRAAIEHASPTRVPSTLLVCEARRTPDEATGDPDFEEIASRLCEVSRRSDVVARLGPGRFAIVVESLPHPVMALRVAERVVAALGAPMAIGDAAVSLSISVGVTTLQPGDSPPEALGRAGEAQRRAAGTGGGFAVSPGDLHPRRQP